jgi:hypothetical protein
MIVVFPRSFGQRPLRILYVPGPDEQRLLEDALAVNQAELVMLP